MIIREETPDDVNGIRTVNKAAFETDAEAGLVDLLREKGKFILSLVAEIDGQIVGHLLLTPASIDYKEESYEVAALAPMAVLPEFQNKGVGKALVNKALNKLHDTDYEAVIVLGHPEYYPKFGFESASKYGIIYEHEVPDEAFMLIELKEKALKNIHGIAKYQPEFNDLT
jgi:putative acetyltransferase